MVRAAPYPAARLAPSGLQLRPHPGSDLAAVVRFALEHEPTLPNRRVSLETYHWSTPPALTSELRTTLQGLADAAAVSICVKSRDDTWELDAALQRARQLAAGPRRAMPGMQLHLTQAPALVLRQRLEQRLELRCELRMAMELQLCSQLGWGDEWSDLPAEAAVPPEFFPIVERIERMAAATDLRSYLDLAAEVLEQQSAITDPYFRMLAICYLAEELGRHENLRPFVRELYAHHFTENFSATTDSGQPSLALLVAASQLRAHVPPDHVRRLVERALGLAERSELDFHGRDARNFAEILGQWRAMGLTTEEAVVWINRFVTREYWVPSAEERLSRLRGTDAVEESEVEPADDPDAMPEAGAVRHPSPWNREERAFLESRLVQHAMGRLVARDGVTEDVFQLFMQLSTQDRWEETAVVAYDLLTGNATFRERLRGALGNFSDPYYRAKAEFVLVRRSQEATDGLYAQVIALQAFARLNDVQRRHEQAVMAETEQREPVFEYVPDLDALALPANVQDIDAIVRWAKAQVAAAERAAGAAIQPAAPVAAAVEMALDADDAADEGVEVAQQAATDETVEARDRRRQQGRRAELLGIVARSLVDASAAIALLETGGTTRELVALISQLPFSTHPQFRAPVLQVAGRLMRAGDKYHAAMVSLLAADPIAEAGRGTPRTGAPQQDDLFRAAVQFLAAAHDEVPGLSNLDVIKDACWLARCVSADAQLQKSLSNLAKARLKLYAAQRTALRTAHDWNRVKTEAEAGEVPAMLLVRQDEILQTLYREGRGHLIASGNDRGYVDQTFERDVSALHDPLSQAIAYALRASYWLHRGAADPAAVHDPARHPRARECLERAVVALQTVEEPYYQSALGMELFQHLLALPLFRDFVPRFGQVFQDRFAGIEARHRLAHTVPRPDQAWFDPEVFARALSEGTLTPALVVRFQTAAQFTKLMRRPLARDVRYRLLAGRIAAWPVQGVLEFLRPLLADAEAVGDVALHMQLLVLYDALRLRAAAGDALRRDFQQRVQRLQALGTRHVAVALTAIEWQWIDYALQRFQGVLLRDLLHQDGLVLADRTRLLRALAERQVVDAGILPFYDVLAARGQSEHFFQLYTTLQRAFPQARLDPAYVQRLLDDPRVQADFGQLGTVIDEWQERWLDFDAAPLPEERLRLLAAEPLLQEQYFGEAEARYRIEEPKFAFADFSPMLAEWAAAPERLDHASCQMWEAALERAHPTDGGERSAAEAAIGSYEELALEEREALLAIIRSTAPLTVAEIEAIRAIGERSELGERLIGELPPNRQRAYRLYYGFAPIPSVDIHTPQSRLFSRDVRPTEGAAPTFFNDTSIRFRHTFQEVAELLTTEWALQEVERRLRGAQSVEATAVRTALDALLTAPGSIEEFAVAVRRLHIRLVAAQDTLTPEAARGAIQRARRVWNDEQVLSLLLYERSLLAKADWVLARHLDRPRTMFHRPLKDLSLDMTKCSALEATPTPAKQLVATRLGFGAGWHQDARQKLLVELEWLAEALQLRPVLRERFFNPMAEQLASFLQQARDPIVFSTGEQDTMRIAHVPKHDIYTYMRIGDFRPCCIASNGTMRRNLRGYHCDRMTQVFAIYNPRTGRPIGHMVGHFGFTGKQRAPTYFLNGLYIRTQHRSAGRDHAALQALYAFAQRAGCTRIRHGINQYHDLSTKPPRGYTSVTSQTIKLVSLIDAADDPVDLYDDLGKNPPNQPAETTHYQILIQEP
ncbi:MAG: hypothetical protein HY696_09840 [Deltaproteobacteria bacterium]|nr:hypothetical protein [Deltaproteobacteria bacterium]